MHKQDFNSKQPKIAPQKISFSIQLFFSFARYSICIFVTRAEDEKQATNPAALPFLILEKQNSFHKVPSSLVYSNMLFLQHTNWPESLKSVGWVAI